MSRALGIARVMLLAALLSHTCVARSAEPVAQTASTSNAQAEMPKTLKERLSDKASDEQRVDNCKVPVELRGSKSRPDACSHP